MIYRKFLLHNFRFSRKILGSSDLACTRLIHLQQVKNNNLRMSSERRYFDNPYPDFIPEKENHYIDSQSKTLHPKFLEKLKSTSAKLMEILEQNIYSNKRDGSVYTGTSGIALLYLMLSEKNKNELYLQKALELIENSLGIMKNRDISFLCGDAGPLAIAAVIFRKTNKIENSKECARRLLALMPNVINQDSNVPDELLYGRVGYLYALLFVNKYIPGTVSSDYFEQVISAVILSGRNLSKRESLSVPLMYEWYEEFYLGGAHGISGIMYLLLQTISAILKSGRMVAAEEKLGIPLMFKWHNKKYLGGGHGVAGIFYELMQSKAYIKSKELQLVKSSVDFLLSIRYSSGNFPTSLGSSSDKLVHWCHGAPGTVQMLCAAYQIFGDKRYLDAAELCGDVVWKRGILKKGYGICHGVAGNAYTFIILYQLTQNLKHLHRACSFADWCTTYKKYQERVPDRPYSLFEGLAGTIYFLSDIQNPSEAKFPCFTL